MLAALNKHAAAVAKLLAATADAKARDKTGWRASHCALYAGAEALARIMMLVEKEEEAGPVDARLWRIRADVQARDGTPVVFSEDAPHVEIDVLERTVTCTKFSTARLMRGCSGEEEGALRAHP
eukprot:407535-Rhodomonas_salina.3